jgi:DNA mismatch endonuclease Vsr
MKHPKEYDTTPQIRKRMSKVQLKNGKAETLLAKKLWKVGVRYRKNYKQLPGSPDIAILKYRVAIFIDGEFWHGKDWDTRKTKLKHNVEYWQTKIEENINRDIRVNNELNLLGWRVLRYWEKDILKNSDAVVKDINKFILSI